MVDKILSTIKKAPTTDFVYSSLSFFGDRKGGELPGTWFVRALGSLGIDERAIRQALFRMERDGSLLSRRVGRVKFYRPSPAASAVLEAGRARVRERNPPHWDGIWTLVHFRVGEEGRKARDGLRDVLRVEGFGALGPALYLHPRARTARFLAAAKELGLTDRINVFRGGHVAGPEDRRLVTALWDPGAIALRYWAYVARFLPVAGAPANRWTGLEAFALRFASMFEFFRISWDDPGLPLSLVPPSWPGEKARKIAEMLTDKLTPRACRYAEEFMPKRSSKGSFSRAKRSEKRVRTPHGKTS